MGASVSSLSPEQKALISKDIQAKMKEYDTNPVKKSPSKILQELALIYEADLIASKEETPGPNISLKSSLRMHVDTDHQLVDLDHVDAERTKLEASTTGSELPPSPIPIKKSTSSADLLNKTNNLLESQAKISSFINQLKEGDITTRRSSGFRIRRLTYAQKTAEEPEKPVPLTSKRTTIYSSREIGVTQEKAPPFPADILGTYSCHGIEPAEDAMDGIKEGAETDDPNNDEIYTGIHQKTNQDRGCVVYPYNGSDHEALLMVLDGHGEQGDRVSEFAMRSIVQNVEKYLKEAPDEIEEALSTGFINSNTALMTTPIKYMSSGSTCVCLYIRGSTYYVANCGDSRAVLARLEEGTEAPKAIDLSRDHKPDDPIEQERILSWGGFVSPAPEPGLSARVWLDPEYTMIGLAMGRSIGDYAVKNVGVIPIPEIIQYEFHPSDKFIIMASDGVWEFISSQEAVDIVQSYLHLGATFACQQLIQTAATRWQEEEGDYRDDITAIVFSLPLPLHESTVLHTNPN